MDIFLTFSQLINLVKIHNTSLIGRLTTIKLLFSREMEITKVSNLFQLHHMLVND